MNQNDLGLRFFYQIEDGAMCDIVRPISWESGSGFSFTVKKLAGNRIPTVIDLLRGGRLDGVVSLPNATVNAGGETYEVFVHPQTIVCIPKK